MPIRISKLDHGVLTLGPTATALEVSCQIRNSRITHAYSDSGDSGTTLCGDSYSAERVRDGRKLEGTILQDFDYAEVDGGVLDFCENHELEEVEFSFQPNKVGAPTYAGTVIVEVPDQGGDVGAQLTADFSWVVKQYTKTYPAGP